MTTKIATSCLATLVTLGLVAGLYYSIWSYCVTGLSEAEMGRLIGGQSQGPNCCSNCHHYTKTVVECGHFYKEGVPLKCEEDNCLITKFDTDCCDLGGDETMGITCTSKYDPDGAPGALQSKYEGLTDCPFGTNTSWRYLKICVNGNCSGDEILPMIVACEGISEEDCEKGDMVYKNLKKPPTNCKKVEITEQTEQEDTGMGL